MTFRVLSCDICTLPTCSDLFSGKRSGSPPEVEYQRPIVTQQYRARKHAGASAQFNMPRSGRPETLEARHAVTIKVATTWPLSRKTVAQKEMRIKPEVLTRIERLKRRRIPLCRAAFSFCAAGENFDGLLQRQIVRRLRGDDDRRSAFGLLLLAFIRRPDFGQVGAFDFDVRGHAVGHEDLSGRRGVARDGQQQSRPVVEREKLLL